MTEYWPLILLVVIFSSYIIYLATTRQWDRLREQAYAAMLYAERVFVELEGEKKMDWVLDYIYNTYMPGWMRLVYPPAKVKENLQKWYNEAKEFLKS